LDVLSPWNEEKKSRINYFSFSLYINIMVPVSSYPYSVNLNSFSGNAQNLRWSIEEQLDSYVWLVNLLSNYKKDKSKGIVHMDGYGRSGLSGDIWENNLENVGIRAVQYLRGRATAWEKGDTYGVLSGAGDKKSHIERLTTARTDGVINWCQTSTPDAPITKLCEKAMIVPGREEQIPEREQSTMAIAPLGTYTELSFSSNGVIIPLSVHEVLNSKEDAHEIIRENARKVTDYISNVTYEMTKRENREKVRPIIEEGVEKEMLLISGFGPGVPVCSMDEIRIMHAGFDGREKSVYFIGIEKFWDIDQKIKQFGDQVSKKVGAILFVDKYFLDESSPFNGVKLIDYLYEKKVDIYSVLSVENKNVQEKSKCSVVFSGYSEKIGDNKEIDFSILGFMTIGDAIVCCWSPEAEMRRRHRKAE